MTAIADQVRQILVEQTSPLETIVFVSLVVAVCLLLATIFYAGLMSLVWSLQLRKTGVGFRQVFLPSANQVREYAPEYVLASCTSLLLAYTTVVRHALIETLKGINAGTENGIGSLFAGAEFSVSDTLGGLSLSKVIQPALEAGRSEEMKAILMEILEGREELTFDPTLVLVAGGLLVISHLLWLAHRRYTFLAENPGKEGTLGYNKTSRSIRVLAVCVALLLAAPTLAANSELLIEGTFAAIKEFPPDPLPEEISTRIKSAAPVSNLAAGVTKAAADIREAGARLDGAEADLLAVVTRLDAVDSLLLETAASIQDHAGRIADLDIELSGTNATIGEIELRLERLASRHAELEGSVQGIIEDIGSHTRLVTELGARLGAAEATINAFDSDVNRLASRLGDLDGDLQAASEDISDNARLLGGLDTRLGGAEAAIDTAGAGMERFETRLGAFETAVQAAQADIQRNARRHSATGFLIVSGVQGTAFTIEGQSGVHTVPAVVPLAEGTYTVVWNRAARIGAAAPLLRDPSFTISSGPQQASAIQPRTQQLPRAQEIELVVTVRTDRATGVTLPWGR